MFIDTSAVVAILAREPDAAAFANKIASAPSPISAGHVVLEASMRLGTILGVDPRDARSAILDMFREVQIPIVPITDEIASAAVDALAQYGKGRGMKAKLSFGDCLSYACARVHGANLLFKGDDFVATDIDRA